MTASTSGKYDLAPRATARGSTLIVSLPDAITPVVWQFDLGSVKASALEVQETKGAFGLRLKTPRGEIHEIAAYADRAKAVSVLSLISRTMIESSESAGSWRMAILAFVILVGIVALLASGKPPSMEQVQAASLSANPQIGVPLSADDVLKGR